MENPKQGTSKNGKPMHYSVGALIKNNGKYLLVDRVKPPFGKAGVSGHIDEGEDPAKALLREIKEEAGLDVLDYELLFEEEVSNNTCSRGISVHYWYVYECKTSGELIENKEEVKSIKWYTKEELKALDLEPVWKYWFKKLKII